MGRNSKLTDELQTEIGDLLARGYTDKDVCAAVGISTTTFYNWMGIGDASLNDTDHHLKPKTKKAQDKYVAFFEAVTRARAEANRVAIDSLKNAIVGVDTVEESVEQYSETRFKDGKPYEYKTQTTIQKVIHHPGDWRAAIEYLKRRDPEHWSEKFEHSIRLDGDLRKMMDRLGISQEQLEEGIRQMLERKTSQIGTEGGQ